MKEMKQMNPMTAYDWERVRGVTKAEAEDIAFSESYHDALACLINNYEHRLTIGGESVYKWIASVFCLAVTNVCDKAVTDYLCALDDAAVTEELMNGVFGDLAVQQKRKTEFRATLTAALKRRKKADRENERRLRELEHEAFLATQPSYYGQPLTQAAVEQMLSENGIEIKLNLVTKRMEVHGRGAQLLCEKYSRHHLSSTLPTLLMDICKENNVGEGRVGVNLINLYLFNIADINRFNPITEMLVANENDDETRLQVLYDILGVTDPLDRTLIRKWLIQTVAFAFADLDRPVSSEGVLVLQGRQGNGKTSFFRRLAGDPLWFTEGAVIDMRNKDTLITALSGWICELGEIDSTLKKEQSALKAFLTRTVDRIRFPYAPNESELPRTTSMCGTVNPEQFLKDSTGNRRYWTIHVDEIDRARLFALTREEIFAVWGYVYHLYLQDNEGFRLTDAEAAALEHRNRDYTATLPYEEEVRALLDFSVPKERWRWTSPSELGFFISKATVSQVGCVLNAIVQENEEVTKKHTMSGNCYFLPLKAHIEAQIKQYQP